MPVPGRRVAGPGAAPPALMGADLRRLRLAGTDIPGGADLANALFWRSRLINAPPGKANLRGAKPGWTDLRHSVPGDADLRGAGLRAAGMRSASLRDADLRGADRRGSDLRGMENSDRANLSAAKANDQTRWPETSDMQAAGVVVPSGE